MTWDTAHILLTLSAASAAAATVAIVVATAVALVKLSLLLLYLGVALPGASGFNFAFNTSLNCANQIDDVLLLGEILATEFYALHSRAGLEHRGDDIASHFLRGKFHGVLRQINHKLIDRVHALCCLLVVMAFVLEASAHQGTLAEVHSLADPFLTQLLILLCLSALFVP